MVEESRVLTLNEVKLLYQFVLASVDESKQRRAVTYPEFSDIVFKIEQQVIAGEIKDVTKRMEEALNDKSIIDTIVSKVALVQKGK